MRVPTRHREPSPESLLSSIPISFEVGLIDQESRSDNDSICEDQDGAQAVLQPAISAIASHLASINTPAVEKAAALEGLKGGGLFDPSSEDCDADAREEGEDGDGDTTPESVSSTPSTPPPVDNSSPRKSPHQDPGKPALSLGQLPGGQHSRQGTPSPWRAGGTDAFTNDSRSNHSKSILGSAFGPTRHHRSRSAGQEAFKRLQKAFPSLSTPSHLLPSLPASFLSNFTDNKFGNGGNSVKPGKSNQTTKTTTSIQNQNDAPGRDKLWKTRPFAPPFDPGPLKPIRQSNIAPPTSPRPPMLRRVTSDDSILYHSLSRSSSLGDNNQFQDVRAMVNIRLMAIRDSLPDVPNLKMPSLARLQAASRRSSISLNAMFSSDHNIGPHPNLDREPNALFKDDATALDRVLEELTGDLVLLGGYRGSVLRSADAPHQQLWAPVKLGLNMRKANLEVGLEDNDEETMEERIIPSGMLKHIGPIDISRKLFKKLRSCENARSGKLRVWDYGYDWRLSPRLLSHKLQKFLEGLPSNQPGHPYQSRGATVIAHSLGGVITRHVVNQRPELFAGVLYAGAPQRCINILGPFRNGDAVLFNEKLLTAAVNFSIRTSFIFLPDDGFCFIDKTTGEEYPIDFHNPDHWVKYHLSPCVQPPLPAFNKPPQTSSPLSALLPNSFLRPRGDSKSEKKLSSEAVSEAVQHAREQIHVDVSIAPQMRSQGEKGHSHDEAPKSTKYIPPDVSGEIGSHIPSDPERRRYYEYLRRTLAMTRQFRAELSPSTAHRDANVYPPFAVLYGKTIPTVYAAQVNGRDAIPCADAYDDLLFRPGDGVVLAKEAMLPEGYSIVRGGRISTERGHLTMLGDLPAVGRALEALLKGRRKGIGLGNG